MRFPSFLALERTSMASQTMRQYLARALDPGRAQNIVKGIRSLSIQNILSTFLGFVLLAFLLRFLPSTEYGAYSGLQVMVSIVTVVVVFGLGSATVKFLAPDSSETGARGWGAAKVSLTLTLLFSGFASLAMLAGAPYLADYFMKSKSWSWVFYLGSLWIFASSMSQVFQRVLQGMRKYQRLARVVLGSRVAAVAAAVGGLVLYRSLAVVILSWALFGIIISAAVLLQVRHQLTTAISGPLYRPVLRYAAPIGLANLVTTVAANADIVVVGGFLSPVSLAVYNAAVIISSVVGAFFLIPLVTAHFAETSFSAESQSEVSKGVTLALRFGLLTVLPASLFAAATAPQLVYLFSGGGVFSQGISYLQIITLFYTFYAVQAISIYALQGVGKTIEVLIVGLITALAEIGLSVALVPVLGLEGAAMSRVTIFVVGCAVSLYFVRPYLKGAVNSGFLGKALVSAGAPSVTVYVLTLVFSSRVFTLLPYTILGLLVFFGCARALKLFSDEDRFFVANILPARLKWVIRFL